MKLATENPSHGVEMKDLHIADKMAIASVASLPRATVASIDELCNAITLKSVRAKHAGTWDVGRESGIGVRVAKRPNALQRFVARWVLGFTWADAE
jgi:hypothetical protein